MGSRESRQAILVREIERIKLMCRQTLLTIIFLRLDYTDLENVPEIQDIADDLLLEKGKFTIDDLVEAIENGNMSPNSKNILKNLVRLLRL